MEFGQLISVPLKDVWPGEATDFTPWLSQNLSHLAEVLGMELELESTEAAAGDFSADIVAREVSTNRRVVIENQYGGTDHRHLGQILTYCSVLNASVVIWVAEKVRQEHKSAVDFLNQNLKSGLQFYAVEASVVRIDSSKPAFSFNAVCVPPDVSIGPFPPGEESETKEKYRNFFQSLIDELRTEHKFTKAKAAQPQNWYTFSSENSKYYKYSASFAQGGRVRVEVYIDCGDKESNESIFESLQNDAKQIEQDFTGNLEWEKLEKKRACRVAIYRDGDIDADSETLADIKRWMIENLLKMRSALPSYLDRAIAKL